MSFKINSVLKDGKVVRRKVDRRWLFTTIVRQQEVMSNLSALVVAGRELLAESLAKIKVLEQQVKDYAPTTEDNLGLPPVLKQGGKNERGISFDPSLEAHASEFPSTVHSEPVQ